MQGTGRNLEKRLVGHKGMLCFKLFWYLFPSYVIHHNFLPIPQGHFWGWQMSPSSET